MVDKGSAVHRPVSGGGGADDDHGGRLVCGPRLVPRPLQVLRLRGVHVLLVLRQLQFVVVLVERLGNACLQESISLARGPLELLDLLDVVDLAGELTLPAVGNGSRPVLHPHSLILVLAVIPAVGSGRGVSVLNDALDIRIQLLVFQRVQQGLVLISILRDVRGVELGRGVLLLVIVIFILN